MIENLKCFKSNESLKMLHYDLNALLNCNHKTKWIINFILPTILCYLLEIIEVLWMCNFQFNSAYFLFKLKMQMQLYKGAWGFWLSFHHCTSLSVESVCVSQLRVIWLASLTISLCSLIWEISFFDLISMWVKMMSQNREFLDYGLEHESVWNTKNKWSGFGYFGCIKIII